MWEISDCGFKFGFIRRFLGSNVQGKGLKVNYSFDWHICDSIKIDRLEDGMQKKPVSVPVASSQQSRNHNFAANQNAPARSILNETIIKFEDEA